MRVSYLRGACSALCLRDRDRSVRPDHRAADRTDYRCPGGRAPWRDGDRHQCTRHPDASDGRRGHVPLPQPDARTLLAESRAGELQDDRTTERRRRPRPTGDARSEDAARLAHRNRPGAGAVAARRHLVDDDRRERDAGAVQQAAGAPRLLRADLDGAGRPAGRDRSDHVRLVERGEPVHHRRPQHDRRRAGRQGQDAQQRLHPGNRSQDRRPVRRVRPHDRRRRQRRDQERRQPVPRLGVRLRRRRPAAERQQHRGAASGNDHARSPTSRTRPTAASRSAAPSSRDRLWFFGAYNRVNEQRRNDGHPRAHVARLAGDRRSVCH